MWQPPSPLVVCSLLMSVPCCAEGLPGPVCLSLYPQHVSHCLLCHSIWVDTIKTWRQKAQLPLNSTTNLYLKVTSSDSMVACEGVQRHKKQKHRAANMRKCALLSTRKQNLSCSPTFEKGFILFLIRYACFSLKKPCLEIFFSHYIYFSDVH